MDVLSFLNIPSSSFSSKNGYCLSVIIEWQSFGPGGRAVSHIFIPFAHEVAIICDDALSFCVEAS